MSFALAPRNVKTQKQFLSSTKKAMSVQVTNQPFGKCSNHQQEKNLSFLRPVPINRQRSYDRHGGRPANWQLLSKVICFTRFQLLFDRPHPSQALPQSA
ncbi:uncharacterized protein ANIA_11402 [Aspergillus nidulans FGSC A4]|uniref:Uncharacterized protein n=1 Tax=Emericella nidulans (strain FGSC A4 / ATCC 38163 / CBS 112.46 / NRRL 194 / M139) TaxID=227321 RepID=C8V4R0_EMENI|nr:hypothetical protein [Aspergillus nidulans FGSC A4]CBF75916.1 TPA: hypothetical protein ANIA_11402 [Aspergillus nidulans FGSC A4]